MKLSVDSPELTAYVLGELPPEQMAQVAAVVAASPELLAEVEIIRSMTSILADQLANEPALELEPASRDAILSRTALTPPTPPPVSHDESSAPETISWWASWRTWRQGFGLGIGLAGLAALALTLLVPSPLNRGTLPQSKPTSSQSNEVSALPAPTSAGVDQEQSLPESTRDRLEARIAPATEPAATLASTTGPLPNDALEPKLGNRYGMRGAQTGTGQRTPTYLNSLPAKPLTDGTHLPMGRGRSVHDGAMQGRSIDPYQPDDSSRRYKTPTSPPQETRSPRPQPVESSSDSYATLIDNPFREVSHSPLSTLSIDVDTASYSNVRRFLREGQLPPPDAVRIEELLNYFPYEYPNPQAKGPPLRLHLEVAGCPWNPDHRLVRVALKARELPQKERAHAHIVFLVDVSGSMAPENKLPLVKRSLRLLVDRLGAADTVGIVTYAGNAEIALRPTSCDDKAVIYAAIDKMEAGSGTNGGEGIQGAYRMARDTYEREAVNRVILCTDGDFNVGITGREALSELIQREAKSGIFLSVLGYGMGNLKDATMELLADKGNGHYAYIDSFTEARKVLSEQLEGTLVTVAKDVKLQIEFNPLHVASWRQIGYENRQLAARDFNDDAKDAGDAGAGHAVTALYEVVPTGAALASVGGPLRYQPRGTPSRVEDGLGQHSNELLLVKVRYKQSTADSSERLELPLLDSPSSFKEASADFKWAAAVAGYGMLLRDSPHRGTTTFDSVLAWAQDGMGRDAQGYRSEFIDLVRRAQSMRSR